MYRVILLINLLVYLLWLPCFAIDFKYTIHTSIKDIDFKKQKALSWYGDNLDNSKFYLYDFNKQVEWLKNKSLKWHENQIVNSKFYFVDSKKELEFIKNKALRWHERNNQ